MNAVLLKNYKGLVIEPESDLFKNIEHTLFRIITGETEKMQEVYDVLYSKEGIRKAFLEYKDAACTVNAENEADPQQLYIKGIVDGMRTFYTFMQTYGLSSNDKRFDFVKEDK